MLDLYMYFENLIVSGAESCTECHDCGAISLGNHNYIIGFGGSKKWFFLF